MIVAMLLFAIPEERPSLKENKLKSKILEKWKDLKFINTLFMLLIKAAFSQETTKSPYGLAYDARTVPMGCSHPDRRRVCHGCR